jgi:hypothetical protein
LEVEFQERGYCTNKVNVVPKVVEPLYVKKQVAIIEEK